MKNSTLLAATDFSVPAGDALDRAAMIAARVGARRLEIVNVASARSLKALKRLLSAEAGPVEARLIEEATVALRDAAEDLSSRYSIQVSSFVEIGNPAQKIAAYADELDASLLVIGSRGLNATRDLMLGTTAEKAIRQTRRPVLVVKQPARHPYRSVMAATDFSEQSLAAVRIARVIAPDASFSAVHAFEVPFEGKLHYAGVAKETIATYRHQAQREAEEVGRAFVGQAGIDGACTIAHGYPSRVIRDHSERMHPDLIAVGKHGRSLIEELLIGSVSEHVLANAYCDVLVAGQYAAGG